MNKRQHHLAARIQRLDLHIPPARRHHDRRINDRRVPARVAARIFIVGGKHRAAPLVQPVNIAVNRPVILRGHRNAPHRNAAAGDIIQRSVVRSLNHPGLPSSAREPDALKQKAARFSRCGQFSKFQTRKFRRPLRASPPPICCVQSFHGTLIAGNDTDFNWAWRAKKIGSLDRAEMIQTPIFAPKERHRLWVKQGEPAANDPLQRCSAS